MRHGVRLAWLAALLAVSQACTTTVETGDAFDLGKEEHRICVPAPEDGEDGTMFGDTWLRALADDPTTIRDVSLVGAVDMELVDAFLVEIEEGEALVGMRHTSNPAPLPAGWEDRVPAEGAAVDPGKERNLVLVVEAKSDHISSADATAITYADAGGKRFQQETLTSMLVSHDLPCDEALSETSP